MSVEAKKRVVMVLIDGLGDVGVAELDNQTPLEKAKTPTMDELASM